MKKTIFAGVSLALFLFACKKDNSNPLQFADYANLEVGNYWIYEQFELDTNGIYTPINRVDSNYVEKDTLINGVTYFKYMDAFTTNGPGYVAWFLRDSLHYLVDWQGNIHFSSENFTDTLGSQHYLAVPGDTLAYVFAQMTDNGLPVTTAAGTFTTKNYRRTFNLWPKFDDNGPVRHLDRRYAEDVGIVEETLYFYVADKSKKYFVRRLKSYGSN